MLTSVALLTLMSLAAPAYASTKENTTGRITYEKGGLDIIPDPNNPGENELPEVDPPAPDPNNPDYPYDPNNPADPNHPDNPTSPNNPSNPNNAFNLKLPTDLNFGKSKVTANTYAYWAMDEFGAAGNEKLKANDNLPQKRTRGSLTILDNTGEGNGWTVSVKQVDQFGGKTAAGEEVTLAGAQLTIHAGEIASQAGETVPTTSTANSLVSLKLGDITPMIEATQGQGKGRTSLILNGFSLEVPGNSMTESDFKTTLNWEVVNGSQTPTNP